MRPLTLGVLVSVRSSQFASGQPWKDDPCPVEGLMDLRSAGDVVEALRALDHAALPVPVDADLDLTLRQTDADACLLALHGRAGGSGDVQALLTMRGLPFCGPPQAAVSLAFDKVRARQVLAYKNLPVPAAIALGRATKTSERALELLGWPCVLKPRRGAHGLGVARLDDIGKVRPALERALDIDDEVVLERVVEGPEIQVALLGERVLGSIQVETEPGGAVAMTCPPELSRGRVDGVHALARRAALALGLTDGLTRVDVIVSPRHNEVILEVEPNPPLHRDGVVARVAHAAGLAYEELISALVDRIVLRAPVGRPDVQARLCQ